MLAGVDKYFDEHGRLAALVIRSSHDPVGIDFHTPLEQTMQLGIMSRNQGYYVEPHTHVNQTRVIHDTNEVLFVRSGLIEVTLYDSQHRDSQKFQVSTGDAVLLAAGGHGIQFLVDSVVIEAKQGPYSEISDKQRFEPSS